MGGIWKLKVSDSVQTESAAGNVAGKTDRTISKQLTDAVQWYGVFSGNKDRFLVEQVFYLLAVKH